VGIRDLDPAGKTFQSVRSPVGRIRIEKAGDQTLTVKAEKIDTTVKRGLSLIAIELLPV
jgi:hypothetical protein